MAKKREPKTNWRILLRLTPFMRPHRLWLTTAIVTGIVGGLVWIQNPLLIQRLTDTAVSGDREGFLRSGSRSIFTVTISMNSAWPPQCSSRGFKPGHPCGMGRLRHERRMVNDSGLGSMGLR